MRKWGHATDGADRKRNGPGTRATPGGHAEQAPSVEMLLAGAAPALVESVVFLRSVSAHAVTGAVALLLSPRLLARSSPPVSAGEQWDTMAEEDTWYEVVPNFNWADAYRHSPPLMQVKARLLTPVQLAGSGDEALPGGESGENVMKPLSLRNRKPKK